jgi:PAS domain S-box-containing protein
LCARIARGQSKRGKAEAEPGTHAKMVPMTEAERHLAALIEAEPECVKTVAPDGTLLSMNPAGVAMLDADSATQLLGHRVFDVVAPEHRDMYVRYHRQICAGERGVLEFDMISLKGTRRHMEATSAPLLTPEGVIHLSITRDITERKRAVQAERMAAIGVLAAGVAHEINNPLSYLLANLQFALGELARGTNPQAIERVQAALEEARHGGERIQAIVTDLKTFSRPDERDHGPVRVSQAIESAITIAWNEIRHRAQLVRRFDETVHVAGNAAQLGQIFLNLLINASHAIPAGAADRHEIVIEIRREGDRAVVAISDTGVGISPIDASRIFEPFVSTKPIGAGTGLGLWICRRIVTDLGGTICVEPGASRGATFRVELPACEPRAPTPRLPTPPPARRAVVAVIDDEPLVARALQRLLSHDHEVVVFERARDAMDWFQQGKPCDIVICDLMMPEVTGMELDAWLRANRPALAARTIFLTGGAFTPTAIAFVRQPDRRCLDKPIDLARLEREIDSLLGPC